MGATQSNKKYGKPPKSSAPKQEHAEWQGFVRCELTEIHKEDLRANPYSMMQIAEWLNSAAIMGSKLSLTYDGGNSTYIVSLTDRNPDSENAGLTVTGRGNGFVNAVQSLMYKVEVIMHDKPWRQFEAEGKNEDFG